MQIISVMSQKGGAGKSTLTRQLSTAAAEDGPAFIIDRDVQATASKWWDRRQTLTPAPERPELRRVRLADRVRGLAHQRLIRRRQAQPGGGRNRRSRPGGVRVSAKGARPPCSPQARSRPQGLACPRSTSCRQSLFER